MTVLAVTIGGVDRTDMLVPGSFHMPDRVSQRSEASFTLQLDAGATWHPQPLDPVLIRLDGVLVFEGFVWDEDEERIVPLPGSMPMLAPIRCVDLHLIADRRIVAETYDGKTAGYIFADLVARYLGADGITAGDVQAGPTLTRVVFNYQSLSKCFDELIQVAGFEWNIVAGRVASFFDRATNAAPWVIDANAPLMTLKVRRHREQYRNRQYLRAGMGTSDPRTDRFKGTGENKTFTCVYPLASKPSSIKVNGVAVNPALIGIRGIDQGKQWYWQKNDPVVSEDDTMTALLGTDTLEITYQGLFPIVIQSDLSSEISSRAAAEGGTGIYEEVEQNANLDNQIAAREFADGKLRQFARLNQEIVFTTTTPGLRAGQLLTVNLPEHGITGTYLITECSLSDGGLGEYGVFTYSVRAADGSSVGDWINFFKRLSEAGKQYAIRENEVMVRLKSAADGFGVTVSMGIFRGTPVNTVGAAQVGFAEVG